MNKAVFLDRDGTINIEKEYLYKIEDFEFIPGTIEGLKLLQSMGFILIIVTNQSGIGRGLYSERDFHKLNDWMLSRLFENGIKISDVFFCPHYPESNILKYRVQCSCRKPEIGLFLEAAEKYNIDWKRSWTIGDKIRDCYVAMVKKCRGVLISNNEEDIVIESVMKGKYKNIVYAKSLYDASKYICDFEKD